MVRSTEYSDVSLWSGIIGDSRGRPPPEDLAGGHHGDLACAAWVAWVAWYETPGLPGCQLRDSSKVQLSSGLSSFSRVSCWCCGSQGPCRARTEDSGSLKGCRIPGEQVAAREDIEQAWTTAATLKSDDDRILPGICSWPFWGGSAFQSPHAQLQVQY